MTNAVTAAHGGDVESIARRYGIPLERILDFSANLNPMGLPPGAAARLAREAADPRVLTRYPDRDAAELREQLAQRNNIPGGSLVIGAGADALIHAAVRALAPRRCWIPVPAFAEYERACSAFGCPVRHIILDPGRGFRVDGTTPHEAGPGDLVILNNPHNPTGACLFRTEMQRTIAQLLSVGANVLADEAFIDYAPDASIAADAAAQNRLIVVRSLTKFFGCAGLRVGYAVAAPETASQLARQLPPWPVTTLAANALAEALRDTAFVRATLENNRRELASLAQALAGIGLCVFPSAANFLLARIPDDHHAPALRERLIREFAIVVRDCDSFQGLEPGCYWRIAVRSAADNARLIQSLATILKEVT